MSAEIKCMIVDDEPLAVDLLKAHINQVHDLTLVYSTNSPIEALKKLKEESIDLLFLDIQMPILTGLELLKTLSDPPKVIFTTAYREYAVESYELKVLDYLVKPITFIRFLKAINKYADSDDVVKEVKPKGNIDVAPEGIFVNVNKRYVKVVFTKIFYIESVKDYIHIHTDSSEPIVTKKKLSEFEENLPSGFLRIHRSFIVNKSRITAFTSQDIEIGTKELPIGQNYKSAVLTALKE